MSAPPTLADRVRNKQYVCYWIVDYMKNMTEESQVSLIISVGNIPDTIYLSFLPF